ncbi:hypothetical protein SAMN04490359_2143 [Streptomyces griseus]|nr:hypothetical protein SAMN04490359_2143 [Streptomyces griseus]
MEPFSREPDGGVLLEDAACDAFAAQILLPAHLVDQHLDAKGPTASAITLLWKTSNASRMAVCVRAAQHLPAPGHVLLLDPDGHLAFAASNGLPPLPRGSFQGDIPVIDRALTGPGRAQGRTQVRYRDGILGRELHTDTAPMDGYTVAVLVTDSAPGAPSPHPPPTPAPGRATTSARTATRTTAPSNPPARAATSLTVPNAAAAPARPAPPAAPAPAASSSTRPRCSPRTATAASTAPDTPPATRVLLPASYVVCPRRSTPPGVLTETGRRPREPVRMPPAELQDSNDGHPDHRGTPDSRRYHP